MRRMQSFGPVVGVVLGMIATLATVTPAAADDKDEADDKVRLENLVDRIVARADPKRLEVLVTTREGRGRPQFKTTRVPDVAAAKRLVADALGQRNVVGVEMNRVIRHATGVPNDPLFRDQWQLDSRHFNFSEILRVTARDTVRPAVAIVDTGVHGNHPDLRASMASSYDAIQRCSILGCSSTPHVISPGTSAQDPCGHGTHVAGIVGARVHNRAGIAGMGKRVYIRSVRVLDASCSGYTADIVRGLRWAADHAHIINMSYEGTQRSPAEAAEIDYALSRGRILVAAAGNSGNYQVNFPAGYSGVLGVGSVNSAWRWSSFSSYGPAVDVMAPGENILSTVPSSSYQRMNGTSMAAPHVAALAALSMAHCRSSPARTTSRILTTASHYSSGRSTYTGWGVINPLKLLRCR